MEGGGGKQDWTVSREASANPMGSSEDGMAPSELL